MRPGIFTPENRSSKKLEEWRIWIFNEAGDFHPRKPADADRLFKQEYVFNEAGDFHPRKPRPEPG